MAKKEPEVVEAAKVSKPLTLHEINKHMHAQNAKLGDLVSVTSALCEKVKADVKAAFERGEDVTKLSIVIAAAK